MPEVGDDLNRACIRGTVSEPPSAPTLGSGAAVVRFKVETIMRWWANGEERRASEYHKITVFNPALTEIASRLRKGERVYLEGNIQTRRYQYGSPPREGITTDIVLNAGSSTINRLDYEPQRSDDTDE